MSVKYHGMSIYSHWWKENLPQVQSVRLKLSISCQHQLQHHCPLVQSIYFPLRVATPLKLFTQMAAHRLLLPNYLMGQRNTYLTDLEPEGDWKTAINEIFLFSLKKRKTTSHRILTSEEVIQAKREGQERKELDVQREEEIKG